MWFFSIVFLVFKSYFKQFGIFKLWFTWTGEQSLLDHYGLRFRAFCCVSTFISRSLNAVINNELVEDGTCRKLCGQFWTSRNTTARCACQSVTAFPTETVSCFVNIPINLVLSRSLQKCTFSSFKSLTLFRLLPLLTQLYWIHCIISTLLLIRATADIRLLFIPNMLLWR